MWGNVLILTFGRLCRDSTLSAVGVRCVRKCFNIDLHDGEPSHDGACGRLIETLDSGSEGH